jgi:hypothetical protein
MVIFRTPQKASRRRCFAPLYLLKLAMSIYAHDFSVLKRDKAHSLYPRGRMNMAGEGSDAVID